LARALRCQPCWLRTPTARLPNLLLEDALQLVRLYGEKESPKYEKAALRWLEMADELPPERRCLPISQETPGRTHFGQPADILALGV
jgi:hypothetical protein